MIFQLLLVFGLPYYKMDWGGKYEVLPLKIRIGSLISAAVILFGLCSFGNITSKSEKEERIMTPLAITLTISFLIISLFA